MKRYWLALVALALGLVIGIAGMGALRVGSLFGGGPDPETIASASLQSVREQARLTPFAARYVAVVTSRQQRFGLSTQKTLIMPSTVRYELDLAKIQQRDLQWDGQAKRLTVGIPPLEISSPQVELNQIREYGGDGLLASVTDAENALDAANRQAGQQELVRQARQPLPMKLARDAARRAVERSFAMPMKAAGVDAEVVVRFADEPGPDPSQMDRSRRIEDVLNDARR